VLGPTAEHLKDELVGDPRNPTHAGPSTTLPDGYLPGAMPRFARALRPTGLPV
jgi:hypothetical protein